MGTNLALGLLWGSTVLLATACSFGVDKWRTYYPLLRLLFLTWAGANGALAAATVYGTRNATFLVLPVAASQVLALVLCLIFLVRRNRIPAYVVVDTLGLPEDVNPARIEESVITVLSVLRHGVASPDLLTAVQEAAAAGERVNMWKRGLRAQTRERQERQDEAEARRLAAQRDAAKGGHDDDD